MSCRTSELSFSMKSRSFLLLGTLAFAITRMCIRAADPAPPVATETKEDFSHGIVQALTGICDANDVNKGDGVFYYLKHKLEYLCKRISDPAFQATLQEDDKAFLNRYVSDIAPKWRKLIGTVSSSDYEIIARHINAQLPTLEKYSDLLESNITKSVRFNDGLDAARIDLRATIEKTIGSDLYKKVFGKIDGSNIEVEQFITTSCAILESYVQHNIEKRK